MTDDDNKTSVTGYWWGYDGKWLTKEEYNAKVAEAEKQRYQRWLETQDEPPEYDW